MVGLMPSPLSPLSQRILGLLQTYPDWTYDEIAALCGATCGQVAGVKYNHGGDLPNIKHHTRGFRNRPPPPRASMAWPVGCRFIHGDPGEPGVRWCDAKPLDRSPYCKQHDVVCYNRRA
jgi:hypothetical protein